MLIFDKNPRFFPSPLSEPPFRYVHSKTAPDLLILKKLRSWSAFLRS